MDGGKGNRARGRYGERKIWREREKIIIKKDRERGIWRERERERERGREMRERGWRERKRNI